MYQTPARSEPGRAGGSFLLFRVATRWRYTYWTSSLAISCPQISTRMRMPSEEKKAEYAATKKAKRHLAKWEADPKTQALQAELRGVRATERFNRAAMHFEDIHSKSRRATDPPQTMVVKSRTRKKEQRPRTRTKTTEHGGRRFVCGAVRSGRRQAADRRRTVCKHQRPTLGN